MRELDGHIIKAYEAVGDSLSEALADAAVEAAFHDDYATITSEYAEGKYIVLLTVYG